jgi:NAD(P)-dependent dehydrogenase (short-subunit alcohol dehydrogenase family)
MEKQMDFTNTTAVVTGTASGIGRAVSLQLAKAGCRLALGDIDIQGMTETAGMITRDGGYATVHPVDMGDRRQVYDFAESVMKQHGKIQILVNNAGVALTALIEEMEDSDFEWLMNINFWGMVHATRAFLPHFKTHDEAHIVNISSVFGLCGIPTQAAYNSSKFAIRGFTESLSQEMHGTGISVSIVFPGGIQTNIVKNSRFKSKDSVLKNKSDIISLHEKLSRTSSDTAALRILHAIRKKQKRVLIGLDAYALDMIQRLFPAAYQRIIPFLISRKV